MLSFIDYQIITHPLINLFLQVWDLIAMILILHTHSYACTTNYIFYLPIYFISFMHRFAIGDLYDGVIWLQLPESFTLSVSYVKLGQLSFKPQWGFKNKRNYGSCSPMAVSCKCAIKKSMMVINLCVTFVGNSD